MNTKVICDNISDAAGLINSDELVAVPTETVYGLAGNGLSSTAVEKIYEVKGRPQVKPLALMVASGSDMEKYCEDVPTQAKLLADKFWPGPLTIVLRSKGIVPEIVRAGGATVALRCPDHEKTLELIRSSGKPLAAPSANPSGQPSPKNAETVIAYFNGEISAVIDGGECILGTESTIIDMSRTPYRILRQGALPAREIEETLRQGLCVIGITGGTGCGKTTALCELKKLGALVIDCDAVYHEMLETDAELITELKHEFPEAFEAGQLNRKSLGRIAFASDESLIRLNSITHSHICRRVEELLCAHAMSGGKTAAVDAVALIESGLNEKCTSVIGITADRELRLQRIMERDAIDRAYAELRISAQKPDEFYTENCDCILRNNGTEDSFAEQCRNLYKEILKNV